MKLVVEDRVLPTHSDVAATNSPSSFGWLPRTGSRQASNSTTVVVGMVS